VSGVILRIEVPRRPPHLAGQHYIIRLTAPDGYTAQRSYLLASSPADACCEFYVARLPDGEVSTYLCDVVRPGDALEVRGPIGRWFVWDGSTPAVSLGGGSGIVPSVAMLRHAAAVGRRDLITVLAVARDLGHLPYADVLERHGAHVALSRAATPTRPAGRLTAADLRSRLREGATYYVCGSAAFTENVSQTLVDLGVAAESVRVERFGPSG
jgi:ferredoxin-NADP reductase